MITVDGVLWSIFAVALVALAVVVVLWQRQDEQDRALRACRKRLGQVEAALAEANIPLPAEFSLRGEELQQGVVRLHTVVPREAQDG